MRKIARWRTISFPLLAVLCLLCYAAYFLHLRADFPSGSPWNDWAKFTDEGWYGAAALRHVQAGHWYANGAFNPAVGLPAWPLLLGCWFAITGPGMLAARTLSLLLFGASLLLLFRLLRPHCGRAPAAIVVLLTLLNPFCFAFQRLAILEPVVVFLFLLALWIATPRESEKDVIRSTHAFGKPVLLGMLLAALVLTKTTAIVLAPALLYGIWAGAASPTNRTVLDASGNTPWFSFRQPAARRALLLPSTAALTAAILWTTYFLVFVRPHYLADFHQLFLINHGHAHGRILLQVMAQALGDGMWIDRILFPLAFLVFAASLRFLRELWRIPLFGSAVLGLAAYIGFIGWHTWFQPRYYLVCVMPMMIVLALGLRSLEQRSSFEKGGYRFAFRASVLAIAVAAIAMSVQTSRYLLHPRYTFLGAANSIASVMRSDPSHPQKLLAGSADDIALLAGITPVSPEYTTVGLTALVHQQQPGWYAAYTPFEDEHTARLRSIASLHPVAQYSVFDDPDHRALVLYRLDLKPIDLKPIDLKPAP